MEDLIVFKTYSSHSEAEIVKGLLASHGINAFLQSDDMGGTRLDMTLVHGVRLMIRSNDKEKAEKILEL